MKSIGKFLNVFTCIGGINVPRKISPVPHEVISTLQGHRNDQLQIAV